MLTIGESRLFRVLIALRDATGAKTRTPVAESLVAALLTDEDGNAGSVSDDLDDLERQGFAQITRAPSGGREVQMTAPGKIKAEEFDRMRARAPQPAAQGTVPSASAVPAWSAASAPSASSASSGSLEEAPIADWRVSVGEVLDAVTQAMSQLHPDATTVVRRLIEDARTAVADGSRPRARRALSALGAYLGDAASGALANVLAAQMVALVARLDD